MYNRSKQKGNVDKGQNKIQSKWKGVTFHMLNLENRKVTSQNIINLFERAEGKISHFDPLCNTQYFCPGVMVLILWSFLKLKLFWLNMTFLTNFKTL